VIPPPPPPLVVGPLTRTDLVRYQGASGDMQPVHHDEEFARAAGYDKPLSLGMLHAGLLGTWASQWLGADRARRFRVRFTAQAFPGDTLTCSGSVVEERPDAVDVELACTTQNGDVVARAWATYVLEASA
jgi:acyl dehydratase